MVTDTAKLPYLSFFLQELSDRLDFLFGFLPILCPVCQESSVTL